MNWRSPLRHIPCDALGLINTMLQYMLFFSLASSTDIGEERRAGLERLWRSEGELVGAWSGSGGRRHLLFSITHRSLQPSQPLPHCVNNHTSTYYSSKHIHIHTPVFCVTQKTILLRINMRDKYAPGHSNRSTTHSNPIAPYGDNIINTKSDRPSIIHWCLSLQFLSITVKT